MTTVVISSEEDAYSALEQILAEQLPPTVSLKFENWPSLQFELRGDGFDSSITPPVMAGLLEFQRGIYRSYASLKYGNPNRRLTEHEKQALQINVRVSKGSSNYEVSSEELIKHFITEMVTKMPAEYVLISVLSIAVMYFGTSFLRTLLDNRKEVRLKEVSDETQRETLEAMKFSAEQETKRTEILVKAMTKVPVISVAANEAQDAHAALIKASREADSAELSGVEFDRDDAIVLTRNGRSEVTQARLDGKYRLLKLDWSEPGSFKVKVQRLNDDLALDADVQDDTLTGAYKDILKNAEWNRKPVYLSINAKKVGDSYRDAVIVKVESDAGRRNRVR